MGDLGAPNTLISKHFLNKSDESIRMGGLDALNTPISEHFLHKSGESIRDGGHGYSEHTNK